MLLLKSELSIPGNAPRVEWPQLPGLSQWTPLDPLAKFASVSRNSAFLGFDTVFQQALRPSGEGHVSEPVTCWFHLSSESIYSLALFLYILSHILSIYFKEKKILVLSLRLKCRIINWFLPIFTKNPPQKTKLIPDCENDERFRAYFVIFNHCSKSLDNSSVYSHMEHGENKPWV